MSTADLLAEVQKERDELRESLQFYMHIDALRREGLTDDLPELSAEAWQRAKAALKCRSGPELWAEARKKATGRQLLVGTDYPVCPDCRAAIDGAALVLRGDNPDIDDPSAPLLFALEHRWLCGGNYCYNAGAEAYRPPSEKEETAKFHLYASKIRGGFGATIPLWDTAFSSQEEALCAAKQAASEKAKESPGRVVCTFGDNGGYFVIETIGDTYMFEVLPMIVA